MENKKKEIKVCKYCQEEIPKKAKRCPKCGGKFWLPGFVKFLIAIVVIFILILAMVSSCAKDVSDSIEETENSYLDIHGKKEFAKGETFESKQIKMTMTETNLDFKDYNFDPKEGYKVVMAKFEVENISEEDQNVSSIYFDAYVDGVSMEDFIWSKEEYETLSATISSGKKTVGYVFFQVPKDTKEVELEYQVYTLSDDKVTFIVK